jgi:Uma2 family endonuclease
MVSAKPTFEVNPLDPRAPPQAVWNELTPAERQRVLDTLPSEIERAEPPEGDAHTLPKYRTRSTLEEHFRRLGRRIYLASELPVYYPDEPMFAPDLMAVLDVETRERDHWTVSHEGRGLDLALEIHVRGSARKDFEDNVERYARLGIPEYFAYAPRRGRLAGWRLPNRESRTYQPIIPQGGRWQSVVLGLDLAIEDDQLRFYHGAAALLDARELIVRLSTMIDQVTERAEQEAQRAEQEAQRAEREAQRAEQAAQRAARYAARLRAAGLDPDEDGS